MFPLSTVLFPFAELPLHIFEPRYRALYDDCMEGSGEFGVVLIERGAEVGGGEVRSRFGTVAVIEASATLPDGRHAVVARGDARFDVVEWLVDDPYPRAVVADRPDTRPRPDDATFHRALTAVCRSRALLSELGEAPALAADAFEGSPPHVATWLLCAASPLSLFDRQRLLGTDDVAERLSLLADHAEAIAEDLQRLLELPGR
jgi:Lon protease-like protein